MINIIDFSNLAIVFIIGVIFSSFLNVIIYRLPKSLSIIRSGSYCPKCSENLKIVSSEFEDGKLLECPSRGRYTYNSSYGTVSCNYKNFAH